MKKNNKIVVLLIILIMMVASFSACSNNEEASSGTGTGNQNAPSASNGTDTPAQEVTMEVVKVWSDNAHEKSVRDRQIEAFNNGVGKELGIEIEYTVFGSNFTDTVKIAAQAGEAPHLYRSDSKWIQEFVDAELIMPIEELPGSEALLDRYKDLVANQSQVFNGKTYTLPYNLTTYGFVVNKDLFEASGLSEADYPTNWEEVVNVAQIITDASGGRAFGFGIAPSALWTISSFYTMGAGQNIGHYGYDYVNQQFAYSDYAPLIKAVDQMVADNTVIPGFETMDGDMLRAQFSAGTIAMMGAASFDVAVYNEQFPAQIEWEVIDIPSFDGSPAGYKRFGQPTNLLVVGQDAKDLPEKVLTVLEFFYDDANAAEMYEEGLYIPVRSEAIALATKQPDAKNFSAFANFDEIFSMAPVPDSLIQFEGVTYREAISNIWTDMNLNDVDAIMAEIDAKYNAALAELSQEMIDLYKLPEGVTSTKSQ